MLTGGRLKRPRYEKNVSILHKKWELMIKKMVLDDIIGNTEEKEI